MTKLISMVNYPVMVKYDGQTIVVSPNETIQIKHKDLLPGKLPAGLILVTI